MTSGTAIPPRDAWQERHRLPRITRLEARYYLALLSMAAIDLLLSAIFLWLSGKLWLISIRMVEVTVFLVALNLAGGFVLFRPIRRLLTTGEGLEAACERAATLSRRTTVWVCIVATLFTLWSFLVMPFAVFGVEPTPEIFYILIGRALAWIVLLPYVAVFSVQNYMHTLRRALFERFGAIVRPGNVKLGNKIALILLGGAIVPAVSIAITLVLVPEISPITGQPRSVVIVTTLVGACVALVLAFRATRDSTTTAFDSLLTGMRAVQEGDLGSRIVIETDDELGRLGSGFNALTDALRESRTETERKERERALAANQFHEAQKREALGQLAAGVAHDFNNILAIIVMCSATVRSSLPEDDPQRETLNEVLKAAERGKGLITQIFDFTRDKKHDHAPIDLNANLQETVHLIGSTLARRTEMRMACPDDPVTVLGDATGLHQVIANIVINAVHAMPEEGGILRISLETLHLDPDTPADRLVRFTGMQADSQIAYENIGPSLTRAWLGAATPGNHACITITDNGKGMSPKILRSVFDPYFTTKPVGKGTGLGLAAVAGVVGSHQGTIGVETGVGTGTTFTICIPLHEEKEPADG